ncbi:uncharacterized protein LOC143080139 isoform X1 [Mytilus galloprovincialis]|uniref:DUF1330 domain-containing protein n=2 Tax=Mytilus galloprovincialis TaxID=29158 RepID=A0A8B6EC95_MYTGA|nr:Hypothetical predicted protein [Mytilus galloprovincialis]
MYNQEPTTNEENDYIFVKKLNLEWAMPGDKKGSCGSQYEKAKDEVYVLMRFRNEVCELVRTACYREKKVIENYNGRVLGLASGVTIYEGNWPCNQGVLLMQFVNKECAERWLNSDRKFRDKEWPLPSSSLEIIIAPLKYKPPKSHLTFQLIELSDFMDAQFQDRYVDKVTPLLDSFHVKHGVVASYDIDGFRNGWFKRGSYCVLNAYDSPSNVDALYYSDQYGSLKEYRQSACRTENVVFTLDPELKPPKE